MAINRQNVRPGNMSPVELGHRSFMCKKLQQYIGTSSFFILISMGLMILPTDVFGQRLSEAEVNRIANRYVQSLSQRVSAAELRTIKEQVRQTGSPDGWQGGRSVSSTTPVTVTSGTAEPVVTVTSSSGGTVSTPSEVTVTSSSGVSESGERSVWFPPNLTVPVISFVPPQMIKTLWKEIYETLQFQVEQIREILSETDVTSEVLAAQLKEKGAKPEQLTELVLALENGEASAVSRIWITAGGDPAEASKIARIVGLVSLLEGIEDSIEEQEISVNDLRNFKRALDKAKLNKETEKAIKSSLGTLENLLKAMELYQNRPKNEPRNDMFVPDGNVLLLLHPKMPGGLVMALDENVFVAGTHGIKKNHAAKDEEEKDEEEKAEDNDEGDHLKALEGSLENYIAAFPLSQATPVVSGTASGQFTLKNTGTDALDFTVGQSKHTLASGETESYAFPVSGKIEFSVTKTRNTSSGGRRSTARQQNYQDKQEMPIAKGITYDCAVESGTVTLSPQPVEITLDNSLNPYPFYVVEGEGQPVEVLPGETQIIGTAKGIVTVRFARSENPGDFAVYEFTKTDTYKPAIQEVDGKWSLFPIE